MRYKDLTDRQKEMLGDCKTPEDILELVKKEGYSLSDEELDAISGEKILSHIEGNVDSNWG